MADEISKVYCYDKPASDNSALWAALMGNQQSSPTEMAALLNNNNMMNNPFFYLIFLMLFRNGFWGEGAGAAANANADINRLSAQVADNNNTQLTMDAIKGNATAISNLASTFNTDFTTMSTAICGVKSAIESVAGQVGYSAERVINAVNLGDANITSQLQSCCCENKQLIQSQGYENQLATERQTGILGSKIDDFKAANQLQTCQSTSALTSRIDQLANGVQTGFANIGYQMAQDKCDIITNATANTQAIKDLLNSHWQNETALALQDEKFKNSQLQQNQYIASLLSNNGCNCGSCGCN